mmetsp:Transcript_19646/g.64991  ORF Transcript_19646/g.64991 Transcript_19646/m.64991 type:complete len:111 (+) Transcript_19646:425-757(+)
MRSLFQITAVMHFTPAVSRRWCLRTSGSWHAVLSTADARRVCELGWAERGPPVCCRSAFQPHFQFAPQGWVFLYAPRDSAECEALRAVLAASHAFALSEASEPQGQGRRG